MTKSEALNTLMKMRAWRRWGKGEQNEKDRPEMPEQKEVDEAFDVCIEMLSKSSLPSNLDEAAEEIVRDWLAYGDGEYKKLVIAGAEWLAGQGVNLSHLIAWYIQSVDAHEPVWTEEHLEELVKDYILIPKN